MLSTRIIRSQNPTSTPLVLLHAFPLSAAMWSGTLDILQRDAPDRDYLTVEFPGFGNSVLESKWDMGEFADMLGESIQSFGFDRVSIAGISMGGYGALAFYRAYPESTSALVLSSTRPGADSIEAKVGREEFARDVERRGSAAALERMLPKFIVPAIAEEQSDLLGKLNHWIGDADPAAIAAALRAMAERPDSTPLLHKMKLPVLVIAGTEDSFGPPQDAEEWAKMIPDAEFVTIAGAGHLSPLDKSSEWARVASEFLRRRLPRT